jgi:hypothetical protein
MSGDKKKDRIDPKERGTTGNVIIVMCKQNLANLLGEHIRCICVQGTRCQRYKISLCQVLECKITKIVI